MPRRAAPHSDDASHPHATRPIDRFVNGSILAVTHVGLAIVLVLAGFAVISRAFAYGGRTPQFEAASGILIALARRSP